MARQVQGDVERDKKELEDSFQRLSEQAQRKVSRGRGGASAEGEEKGGSECLLEKPDGKGHKHSSSLSADSGAGGSLGSIEEGAHCQQTGTPDPPKHH